MSVKSGRFSSLSSGRSHILHCILYIHLRDSSNGKRLCISPVLFTPKPRDPSALPSYLSSPPKLIPAPHATWVFKGGRPAATRARRCPPKRTGELGRENQMLARVPCSLQPPGQPIVLSSSHASRMCLNRDALSFSCAAVLGCSWGERLEIRTPYEGTGTSCTT